MVKPKMIRRDEDGNAVYDLSDDDELAETGDEDALARKKTKRFIRMRRRLRETHNQFQ